MIVMVSGRGGCMFRVLRVESKGVLALLTKKNLKRWYPYITCVIKIWTKIRQNVKC